jgi:hypothetical protein
MLAMMRWDGLTGALRVTKTRKWQDWADASWLCLAAEGMTLINRSIDQLLDSLELWKTLTDSPKELGKTLK